MEPLRHIGLRHIHFDVTDSTNSRAAELAHDPAYAGTVVTADLQAQGRGQYGREWQSPPDVNVLLSVLLFPPPILLRPAVLTAFAAMAVCETVLEYIGQAGSLPHVSSVSETRIKWPNDVLVDGKKTAGILIESGVSAAGSFCVVGIGLNVNLSAADIAKMDLPNATSLSLVHGRLLGVSAVKQSLIHCLDREYGRAIRDGLSDLQSRWAKRIGLVGQPITVERMDGVQTRGRLIGLGFESVVVERDDGTTLRLSPEEVRHLR